MNVSFCSDVNWGSSTQCQSFKTALSSVQSLNQTEDHVKNFSPQILVLSGIPSSRPTLIDIAYLMTKNVSMLVCGHIIQVYPI
jgi:solute carrier family 12 sodium/potassium/chloride transporter 2